VMSRRSSTSLSWAFACRPVLGWADHPWFGTPAAHSRAQQGAFMYLKAKRWIQQHYSFWVGTTSLLRWQPFEATTER
jgi:hypothetical protein